MSGAAHSKGRDFELWGRRFLSTRPRLRTFASTLRRLVVPARWRALASRHWDSQVDQVEAGQPRGWLDWQLIEEEYVRPQISGDRRVFYVQHFLDHHVANQPVERALSVGCGGGHLERSLIEIDAVRHVDAFDVSPESIRLAQELAEEAGFGERIEYRLADADSIELPAGAYDFVIVKMALHHFENLEHVYATIRRSLKPGGVFMLNEFVGPSRFQWTDLQLELMNELLATLPERHRRAAPFARVVRPGLEDMKTLDPSESVRSAEILPLLEREFEILEHKPYGGTLLHIPLSHVMPAFDLEDESELALLRLMFLYERTLIRYGVLPSDFAYVVARRR